MSEYVPTARIAKSMAAALNTTPTVQLRTMVRAARASGSQAVVLQKIKGRLAQLGYDPDEFDPIEVDGVIASTTLAAFEALVKDLGGCDGGCSQTT